MRTWFRRTLLAGLFTLIAAPALAQDSEKPIVTIKTNLGDIKVQLSPRTAPRIAFPGSTSRKSF